MTGAYLRKYTARFLKISARLSKIGFSANCITFLSFFLSIFGSILIINKKYFFAGVLVVLCGFMDLLDGTVARLNLNASKFGDYFDAIVDRYREIIFYFGFALSGYALEAFIALSGALLISFSKARTAMCVQIDDHDWPAIGDMCDRMIILTTGLLIVNFMPYIFVYSTISVTLIIIGLVTHVGSIWRFFYAKALIERNK